MKVFVRKFLRERNFEHYLLKMRMSVAEYERENWILAKAAQGEHQEKSFIRADDLRRKIERLDKILNSMSCEGRDMYAPLRRLR